MNTLKNVLGKIMENKSKTFCVMPFVHQNLKQEGRVTACWRAQGDLGNNNKNTLTEIFNSDETKELRRAVLNNERPEGCRSCWDAEDSGVDSTRLQTLTNWDVVDNQLSFTDGETPKEGSAALEQCVLEQVEDDYSFPIRNLKSIEVRFDNICNLMCRHCSPVYSSLWEKAVRKMPELDDASAGKRRESQHISLNADIVDEVEKLAPHLEEILITGGEPLYHTKHFDFLKKLEPYAHNITLNYNSNFATLEYAGQSILPLWRKFKRVGVLVSVDADPKIYPYVRVHGHIDKVEANIKTAMKELDNLFLQTTCTTSVLNITRLTEVFEYFISLNTRVHASLVQYPSQLNPRILPKEMKVKITEEWNAFVGNLDYYLDKHNITSEKRRIYYKERIPKIGKRLITYMNASDLFEKDWKNFMNFSKTQDTYHSTDILEYYPEFKEYWNA